MRTLDTFVTDSFNLEDCFAIVNYLDEAFHQNNYEHSWCSFIIDSFLMYSWFKDTLDSMIDEKQLIYCFSDANKLSDLLEMFLEKVD